MRFICRWLKIHCQVTPGIDMSGFRIMSIGDCEPQEESDNDRLSGELVPIISRDQFEYEAEKFLTIYCPEALDKLSKGYCYQSKYQGARYYTQFMRNFAPVENQIEYSFELNALQGTS